MKTTHCIPNIPSTCRRAVGIWLAWITAVASVTAANKTWDGGGADNFWQTGANWNANTAPVPGDVLTFSATTRLNSTNDFTAGTGFAGINILSPAGAFALGGNSISLDGNITNNQPVTTETINLPLSLSATRVADVSANASLTLNGVVSGSGFGLIKAGGGLLTLGAANIFDGALSVNAGTASVSSDGNLGTVPGAATPGKVVLNNGTLRNTATFTLNANRGLAVGPGAGRLDAVSGTTLTYRGIIANNGGVGGLTKGGFGTLLLSAPSTYSGATIVKNGSLNLDFNDATSPANDVISSVSTLTLGGENAGIGTASFAALNVTATSVKTQNFAGTTIDIGPAIIRATNANVSLGSLAHNAGANLVFVTNGTSTLRTASANENGILGGWAVTGNGTVFNNITMGTEYATVDGSGYINPYTGYTVHLNSSGNLNGYVSSATNLRINGSSSGDVTVSPSGAGTITDINSLNLSATRAFSVIVGANNTLRLGRYGAIFKSDFANNITWALGTGTTGGGNGTQDVGTLTAGGAPDTPGEINFVMNNNASQSQGSLNVECRITDNGAGPVTIIKSGPQAMKLRGHNTFSGGMYVLGGRMQLAGSEIGTGNPDGGGTGKIVVMPGAYLFLSGIGTLTGGQAISNLVQIAGNGTQQEPVGAIRFGNGAHIAGTVELIGDARIGGGNAATIADTGISGKITGGFALDLCAVQTINSFFTLRNPLNDWSGTTTFNARNTASANQVNNGANEVIPHGFGRGNVVMNGNTSTGTIVWDLNGFNETINGLETSANNPSGCIIQNGGAAVSTLTVGDNDQSGTFAGTLQDGVGQLALTKISGGSETLAGVNTYTGPTVINGGVLALSGSGSIGSSSEVQINSDGTFNVSATTVPVSTAGAVRMNGGTLVSSGVYDVSVPTLAMTNSELTVVVDPARNNVIAPSLVTGGTTNRINIAAVVGVSGYPAQFTLIDYNGSVSGAGNNFGLGEVPNVNTVGYITNDTANSRIVLVLNDGPKPLTWAGTNAASPTLWDLNTTANWIAFKSTVNEVGATFNTADGTFLDDTAGTNDITLVGSLEPGGVTVNNSTLNYTFNGSGAIAGLGGLLKQGAGSLLLNNSGLSSFSGGINVAGGSVTLAQNNAIAGGTTIASGAVVVVGTNGNSGNLPAGNVASEGSLTFNRGATAYTVVNKIIGGGSLTKNDSAVLTLSGVNNTLTGAVAVVAGTLRAGSANALGTADGNTTISSGATLDVNDFQLNTEPIIVGGAGAGSAGAIVNSGAAGQINAMGNVTLTADTTFGGTGRWDIRGGLATLSTSGNAYNLTKVGNNQISLVGVNVDGALASINVNAGTFSVETSSTGLGNPASTLTVASGGTFQVFANTVPLEKIFVLNGNGQTNTVNSGSGSPVVQGATTISGNTIFNVGGTSLSWNGAIGGSGTLRKAGAAILTLGGNNTYSGNTTNTAGTLTLTGSNSGGGSMTNFPGATLAARGSHTGAIQFGTNATFHPGGSLAAGTIACGPLLLNNSVLGTDLGFPDESAVINNDGIIVTGNLTLAGLTTNIVQAGFVGAATNGQTITIIQYSGTLVGGTNNLRLIAPPGYVLTYLDPATTPGLIQIRVISAPALLTWRGQSGANPTFWDIATTLNWLKSGGVDSTFTNFDAAVFDDTALGGNVNLTTTLIPSFIAMNNNTLPYTFTGSGRLTGTMSLDVSTGGKLTIANSGSNDFTGPIRINSGTLQVGSGGTEGNLGSGTITNESTLVFSRGGTLSVNNGIHGFGSISNSGTGVTTIGGANTYGGSLTVASGTVRGGSGTALGNAIGSTQIDPGATLDVGGQVLNAEQVTVSGNGVGGAGAIINSGPDQLNAMGNVLLAGDTRFGGTARWDIRGGAQTLSTGGNPYNLTKVGSNQFTLVAVLVDPALANIDVQAGTFSIETTTSSLGNPLNTFTLSPGATFQMFNHQVPLDKVFLLSGNGVANTINVSSGTFNLIVGPATLSGGCIINITAANVLSMAGAIGGSGSLTKTTTGTLNLSGLLSYSGNTTVNGGALVVNQAAELTNSPVITLAAGTLLDVTGLFTGPTLHLVSGQRLQGNGSINGGLIVDAGATVSPGVAAGTLTVTNDIALAGVTSMDLHPAINTNDLLRSITGTITYGGTLTVTNIGGLLANGASFKLFNASSYLGSFSSIQLPGLGVGQSWNTSQLNINGTISVVGSPAPPTISSVTPSGSNLTISGAGGVTNGFYSVVTSTNVATPLSTWTVAGSGQFDGNGQFSIAVPVDEQTPQRFFVIRMP